MSSMPSSNRAYSHVNLPEPSSPNPKASSAPSSTEPGPSPKTGRAGGPRTAGLSPNSRPSGTSYRPFLGTDAIGPTGLSSRVDGQAPANDDRPMALYEYVCASCGIRTEKRMPMSDVLQVVPCPKCGKQAHKAFGRFALVGVAQPGVEDGPAPWEDAGETA
ncbi:MAG: hypothetical protein C4321_00430, partial [Chloroflexota bacterium]